MGGAKGPKGARWERETEYLDLTDTSTTYRCGINIRGQQGQLHHQGLKDSSQVPRCPLGAQKIPAYSH